MVQGPADPFGRRPERREIVRAVSSLRPRRSTMSEDAVEERRGWASDIVWVVLYSILVLLVMLLCTFISLLGGTAAAWPQQP
jgi:hypothetical protein